MLQFKTMSAAIPERDEVTEGFVQKVNRHTVFCKRQKDLRKIETLEKLNRAVDWDNCWTHFLFMVWNIEWTIILNFMESWTKII